MDISSLFNKCDIISDQYFEGSLKERAREDHGPGTGHVITFHNCFEIPPNSSANS